jgi:hypothetical protein
MSLLTILLVIVIVGVVLYLVNNYIPMDQKIKQLLNWVVVIVLIIWILKAFKVFSYLEKITL